MFGDGQSSVDSESEAFVHDDMQFEEEIHDSPYHEDAGDIEDD